MDYLELQKRFDKFVYKCFEKEVDDNHLTLFFEYELVGDETISFRHKVTYTYINDTLDLEQVNSGIYDSFIFHIGLVETINYWKLACPKTLEIQCGVIDDKQVLWWKKLFYHGLGEFIYLNKMTDYVNESNFIEFRCTNQDGQKAEQVNIATQTVLNTVGNLIPVGGGKDSVVSLEVLRDGFDENVPFVMSPPIAAYDCIKVAGYNRYLEAKRVFDKRLIEMNDVGYLNGHVPFSAILAFISTLGAAMIGKRYVPLSNERSANEPSVIGTTFNHQYSKSYEFEQDFGWYLHHYLTDDIRYFSLLRTLYEIEIGKMFSHYKQYHKVYRSCNRGKKTNTWCGVCPKCLFVYIILSPYIGKAELVDQFGKDLYEDESLIPIFDELIGIKETKPFECVGTIWEVRYALNQYIEQLKGRELPKLLQYYTQHNYHKLDDTVTDYEEGDLIPDGHRLALEREMSLIG